MNRSAFMGIGIISLISSIAFHTTTDKLTNGLLPPNVDALLFTWTESAENENPGVAHGICLGQ